MRTCWFDGADISLRRHDAWHCGPDVHPNAWHARKVIERQRARAKRRCVICNGPLNVNRVGVACSRRCNDAVQDTKRRGRQRRCPVCKTRFRRVRRQKYCRARCRIRAWVIAHGGWGYESVSYEPLPMPYTGDPVFERARQAAHMTTHTDYAVDWGQNDMMGEAVLAILEGRDPEEAVRKFRATEKRIDRACKHMPDMNAMTIGEDGRVYFGSWDEEAA